MNDDRKALFEASKARVLENHRENIDALADPYAALREMAACLDGYRWWYHSDVAQLRALLMERDTLVLEKRHFEIMDESLRLAGERIGRYVTDEGDCPDSEIYAWQWRRLAWLRKVSPLPRGCRRLYEWLVWRSAP